MGSIPINAIFGESHVLLIITPKINHRIGKKRYENYRAVNILQTLSKIYDRIMLKDTHREKAPSNKTLALTKSMNTDI